MKLVLIGMALTKKGIIPKALTSSDTIEKDTMLRDITLLVMIEMDSINEDLIPMALIVKGIVPKAITVMATTVKDMIYRGIIQMDLTRKDMTVMAMGVTDSTQRA